MSDEVIFAMHGLVALMCLAYISRQWRSLWLWGFTTLLGLTMTGLGWTALNGETTWRLVRTVIRLSILAIWAVAMLLEVGIMAVEERRTFSSLDQAKEVTTAVSLMRSAGNRHQSVLATRFSKGVLCCWTVLFLDAVVGW